MIAIYRANPAAFQNNFNRMHTGVTLTFPTAEQLAAISVDDTNREYDRQMAEWRASLHHGASACQQERPPELAMPHCFACGPSRPRLPTPARSRCRQRMRVAASWPRWRSELADRACRADPADCVPGAVARRDSAGIETPAASATAVAATAAAASAIAGSLGSRQCPRAGDPTAAAMPANADTLHATPRPNASAPASLAATDEATSEDDEDDALPVKHRGYQLLPLASGRACCFSQAPGSTSADATPTPTTVTPRYPAPGRGSNSGKRSGSH